MNFKYFRTLLFLFLSLQFSIAFGQKVTGIFPALAHKQIKLLGYNGFNTYAIDSIQANNKGEFRLNYNKKDIGMGYLLSENGKSFLIILGKNENLKLTGINFEKPESIKFLKGKQNILFDTYAREHSRREHCLSGWDYLTKIYKSDSLFSVQKTPKQAIKAEKKRINAEDSLFLAHLPKESYVSYYLPLRKLFSSVGIIAQYRTEELPATIASFRNIDYTDPRLYKSGLLKDALESHFWLLENSGSSMDAMYKEMQTSIDGIIANLQSNESKLNDIAKHLFKLLEKRSLFKASEYLALKLLNEKSCTLNSDFASQLESYRAMKKGNIAPDIVFSGAVSAPSYTNKKIPKKLSDIKSKYKVVLFGAGWCPHCPKALQQVTKNYTKWKAQGVEVIFVSLDDDKQVFSNFTKPFPFISTCDFKKWESPAVKDYHVFATPSIYLLNENNKIILKPKSIDQLNTWVDWYLVKGNK